MRRTILRIEKEYGEPLDIEVNGRCLTGKVERGALYAAVVLLALGTMWVTVAIVLPLLWAACRIAFSMVGFGTAVVAVVLALVLLWVVVRALLERSSGGRRGRDGWDD